MTLSGDAHGLFQLKSVHCLGRSLTIEESFEHSLFRRGRRQGVAFTER